MASTSVGGAINNCVHVAEHAGQVRLYVCNNDETIKIFNLPTMEHVSTIRLNTAVNGVCVSPDGSRMVAVGDTNQVFLFGVGVGPTAGYEQLAIIPTTKDAGFSCAWDQTSTKFAVGCQDGFTCVWDIRSIFGGSGGAGASCSGPSSANTKKLAQIPSAQMNGRGAVRSVKFSQSGSVDLLAFTEVLLFIDLAN